MDQHIKVTADAVIFRKKLNSGGREVLLIQRKHPPFKGSWAFPGGFVEENENLLSAAARELREETGLEEVSLTQVGAFGDPGRDPRGPTVTVAFAGSVMHDTVVSGGDDAENAQWFDLTKLPALAFDHEDILRAALLKVYV